MVRTQYLRYGRLSHIGNLSKVYANPSSTDWGASPFMDTSITMFWPCHIYTYIHPWSYIFIHTHLHLHIYNIRIMKATLHACSALHQTIGCAKQTAMDSRAPNHTEPRWDATLSTGLGKGMQKRPRRQPRWVIQGSIMIRTSPINSNHGSKAGSHHVLPFQNGIVWKSKKIQWSIISFSHFTHWTAPVWYPPFSDPNCLDWFTESPAHPHLHVGRIARHLVTKFRMCLSSDSGELDTFHRNFTWVSRICILGIFW